MKNTSFVSGFIGIAVGFLVFVLGIDLLGKPSNEALSFNPIEALASVYFMASFGWGLLGVIILVILLIVYFALCFGLGKWISRCFKKQ